MSARRSTYTTDAFMWVLGMGVMLVLLAMGTVRFGNLRQAFGRWS